MHGLSWMEHTGRERQDGRGHCQSGRGDRTVEAGRLNQLCWDREARLRQGACHWVCRPWGI